MSLSDGPFCQATLDGISTQAVAATACPGPPGAERATNSPGGIAPSQLGTSLDLGHGPHSLLAGSGRGSCLHLLPAPDRYLQVQAVFGKDIPRHPAPRPGFFPAS